MTELRDGPIGRFIPGRGGEGAPAEKAEPPKKPDSESARAPSLVDQAKEKLEEWQHQIDDRVKTVLPSILPWQQLELDVKRLTERVAQLEADAARRREHGDK